MLILPILPFLFPIILSGISSMGIVLWLVWFGLNNIRLELFLLYFQFLIFYASSVFFYLNRHKFAIGYGGKVSFIFELFYCIFGFFISFGMGLFIYEVFVVISIISDSSLYSSFVFMLYLIILAAVIMLVWTHLIIRYYFEI